MSNVRSITPNEPANFSPELGNYKTLQPFRFWCQKVLPLAYDDSLSYYELLCKLVDYLNKTMEDVETLHGDVTNLHTAYNELQSYVNNYFSTLDVQEEINNKLDRMVADGTFNRLIKPLVDMNFESENARITLLENRMDTFSALGEGSTTGDAELIDGRIDFTGKTWDNIGDNIRENDKYDNDLFINRDTYGKKYVPFYNVIQGKFVNKQHVVQESNNFNMVDMIRLLPGQAIFISSYNYNGYPILTEWSADGTFVSDIWAASSTQQEILNKLYYLNTSNAIKYYRVNYVNTFDFTLEVSCVDPKYIYYVDAFVKTNGERVITGHDEESGYYMSTTPILVKKGEEIVVYSSGSESVSIISECNKTGGFIRNVKTGGSSSRIYRYAPNKDSYYIATVHTSTAFNVFVKPVAKNIENVVGNTKEIAVINFQFDDGSSTDTYVFETFNNKGLKCGFVLPTSIDRAMNRYKEYVEAGFEVLSHSTDGTPMSTDEASVEDIRYKMVVSKNILNGMGFNVRGWVTPNSELNPIYQPILTDIYDYAFTHYYDNTMSGTPYNEKNDNVRELHRVLLAGSFEDNKAMIDSAINNNGFISFYFHSRDLNDNYKAVLNSVLDYVNNMISDSKLVCLSPNQAFDYYYCTEYSYVGEINNYSGDYIAPTTYITQSITTEVIGEVDVTTSIVTKDIPDISEYKVLIFLAMVDGTYRGSEVIPYNIFSESDDSYIPVVAGTNASSVYLRYVSNTSIMTSCVDSRFNKLKILGIK